MGWRLKRVVSNILYIIQVHWNPLCIARAWKTVLPESTVAKVHLLNSMQPCFFWEMLFAIEFTMSIPCGPSSLCEVGPLRLLNVSWSMSFFGVSQTSRYINPQPKGSCGTNSSSSSSFLIRKVVRQHRKVDGCRNMRLSTQKSKDLWFLRIFGKGFLLGDNLSYLQR